MNDLGKTYTNYELMCKVLRSLSKKWKAKIMIIQDAKDLTKLSLLSRKFKKFLMKKSLKKKENKEKKQITSGKKHSKRTKRSALLGIWEDSDNPSLDEEENVNLCLMTLEDEENSKTPLFLHMMN